VKTGALASHGRWIALIDADLDIDPSSIPSYLDVARREKLDFAIGSKRHPESVVDYPRSRRVASWCYQQLNRLLFRLDVRDTASRPQGLQRARRRRGRTPPARQRFAFDLELLAVARALGFSRVVSSPCGSTIASPDRACDRWPFCSRFGHGRDLLSTACPADVRTQATPSARQARASVACRRHRWRWSGFRDPGLFQPGGARESRTRGRARRAHGHPRARRSPGRELDHAAVRSSPIRTSPRWSYRLSRRCAPPSVNVSPLRCSSRDSASGRAAPVTFPERPSRRRLPGREHHRAHGGLCSCSARRSRQRRARRLACSPRPPNDLHARHVDLLRSAAAASAAFGRDVPARACARCRARRTRGRSLSRATALSLTPVAAGISGLALWLVDGHLRTAALALVLIYAAALAASGIHAAIRFRSLVVGLLEPPAVVASQATYLAGFVRGLVI